MKWKKLTLGIRAQKVLINSLNIFSSKALCFGTFWRCGPKDLRMISIRSALGDSIKYSQIFIGGNLFCSFYEVET